MGERGEDPMLVSEIELFEKRKEERGEVGPPAWWLQRGRINFESVSAWLVGPPACRGLRSLSFLLAPFFVFPDGRESERKKKRGTN